MEINFSGLLVGMSTFLIIGLFHPLVIKGEYYFGQRVNWAFAIGGVLTAVLALHCESLFTSAVLSVVAFSCFWSIHEVHTQKKRVERGWFPMNPKRRHEYRQPEEKKDYGKVKAEEA